MTPLNIPVPPQLEAAVGYEGNARLLSLAWTSCGDNVWYDDGRWSGTGLGWGYLGWVRHPAVSPLLSGYDLGNSLREGPHRILVDRHTRTVSIGDADEVFAVVRNQWPIVPASGPVVLSNEDWDRLVRLWQSQPLPTLPELLAQMREHSRIVAEMVSWLDLRQAGEDRR